MEAVNDYVIIRKDHSEKEHNGIILPFETQLNRNGVGAPYTGKVESTGDMVTIVKNGDHVIFYDLSQPWIIEDKQDLLLIMKEINIIGILQDGQ